MRVLVTGGTGVVGRSTVTALIQRGHVVQLLARNARRDVKQWPHGVNAVPANIAEAASLAGAADGCDVVLHLTSVVDESGPNTFDRVNVEGTRNVMREAERAGVKRFIYVSSLGADRGTSAYHQSKRKAEAIVRQFSGSWTVIRPGSVYGPGDEQISLLLRMVRTLPTLPVLGDGDQRFQPIWHEDLAELLAQAVEREDLHGKELDVAGPELTTQNDLVQRLSTLTGRAPARIQVPEFIANIGVKIASAVGLDVSFNDSQLKMLSEGSEIGQGRENALVTQFQVTPTSLDAGLRTLTQAQDEQLPDEGIGPLRRKRYWADITGSRMGPEQLMAYVKQHFTSLMASFIDSRAEPQAATTIEEDATLTLSLPLRGHVQVRVAESEERVFTLVTLSGHPLSGAVRFLGETRGTATRFEVQVFDRAANVIDLVMMRTLGERLQDVSWREMIDNVVKNAGGTSTGVQQDSENLEDDQAERIEEWLRDIVMERKRESAGI